MLRSPDIADTVRTGTGKKLFSGTAVLTVSAVLTKIIGLLYKIPILKYVGVEGMAYFLAANHVYVFLFVIATSGLPVAVSVLVSGAVASGDRSYVRKIYKTALFVFVIVGTVCTMAMLMGAQRISELISIPRARYCMIALAPAVLMGCISGAVRGYFQGHQIMLHTAVSQMIESIGKLALGLVGAVYASSHISDDEIVASFAVFGITVGSGLSMIYLVLVKRSFDARDRADAMGNISPSPVLAMLIRLAMPITLSSAILSFGGVIDTALIPSRLVCCGFSQSEANRLYSCYGNMAVPLFSLIPSMIAPIATALVPLVASKATHGKGEERSVIDQAIFFTMAIAVPASMGTAFFSGPILRTVFLSDNTAVAEATPMLSLLALSIVPSCLITITNSVLHAKKYASITILSMVAGIAVKLVSEYFLVGCQDINILGAPISTLLCDITVIIINIFFVFKATSVSDRLLGELVCVATAAFLSVGSVSMTWATAPRFSSVRGAVAVAIALTVALYFSLLTLFVRVKQGINRNKYKKEGI